MIIVHIWWKPKVSSMFGWPNMVCGSCMTRIKHYGWILLRFGVILCLIWQLYLPRNLIFKSVVIYVQILWLSFIFWLIFSNSCGLYMDAWVWMVSCICPCKLIQEWGRLQSIIKFSSSDLYSRLLKSSIPDFWYRVVLVGSTCHAIFHRSGLSLSWSKIKELV